MDFAHNVCPLTPLTTANQRAELASRSITFIVGGNDIWSEKESAVLNPVYFITLAIKIVSDLIFWTMFFVIKKLLLHLLIIDHLSILHWTHFSGHSDLRPPIARGKNFYIMCTSFLVQVDVEVQPIGSIWSFIWLFSFFGVIFELFWLNKHLNNKLDNNYYYIYIDLYACFFKPPQSYLRLFF